MQFMEKQGFIDWARCMLNSFSYETETIIPDLSCSYGSLDDDICHEV